MSKRIRVTVLTGYLGAGKTTLLNRILSENHGHRIAVIENEFGEISIDDQLITNAGQTVLEMSNGCICCTVRGDLVQKLSELAAQRDKFDYIVIETTGLANPRPVVETFVLNEELSEYYQLDGVVTLVDALHITQHLGNNDCIEQIAFADVLILNKLDLVGSEDVAAIEHRLRSINGLASLYRTRNSTVPVDQILDIGKSEEERTRAALSHLNAHQDEHHGHDCEHDHDHHDHHCEGHHHHLHGDDVSSVGIERIGDIDGEQLGKWLSELLAQKGDDIFRVKGILSVQGMPNRMVIQAVHKQIDDPVQRGPWNNDTRTNQIIFIGRGLDRAMLTLGFESCLVKAG